MSFHTIVVQVSDTRADAFSEADGDFSLTDENFDITETPSGSLFIAFNEVEFTTYAAGHWQNVTLFEDI